MTEWMTGWLFEWLVFGFWVFGFLLGVTGPWELETSLHFDWKVLKRDLFVQIVYNWLSQYDKSFAKSNGY